MDLKLIDWCIVGSYLRRNRFGVQSQFSCFTTTTGGSGTGRKGFTSYTLTLLLWSVNYCNVTSLICRETTLKSKQKTVFDPIFSWSLSALWQSLIQLLITILNCAVFVFHTVYVKIAASHEISRFVPFCSSCLSQRASNPDYHQSAKQAPEDLGERLIKRSHSNHLLLLK